MTKYILFLCCLGWVGLPCLQAQNLDQFDWKKGFTVQGSLNLNAVAYKAWRLEQRREPFNYFLTGNLSLGLFGYSAPFSFSYSNIQTNFTQPFNQFRFSPQYKWVKTYIGTTSMTFSNYTLAGHLFSGVGVELTPKKWKVSAMYGRLRKAVAYSLTDTLQHKDASYQRMGYGLKVGYEGEKQQIGLIFFHAKDDPKSLEFVLPTFQLTPQQNVAIGTTFKRTIKKISIEAEYNFSVLNTNILAEPNAPTSPTQNNSLLKFLMPKQNSLVRFFDAFSTSVGYQGSKAGVSLRYERVAPEYQTLGAYFFNNDMENWTIQPNFKLLKDKISISGQTGLQRNNLDESRTSTTKRWVNSVNISYIPKEAWNLTANYSNFSTFTRVRPQPDPFFQNPLDSLNFYQVNHTAGGTVMYMFGSKERKQNVMFAGNYQQAKDQASNLPTQKPSRFINANASYTLAFTAKQMSFSLALNAFQNTLQDISSQFIGPSLNFSKTLFKKRLRSSLTSSYSYTSTNSANAGDIINSRVSFQYTPQPNKEKQASKEKEKKRKISQNLSFNLNHVQRFGSKGYSEITATLNAGVSF